MPRIAAVVGVLWRVSATPASWIPTEPRRAAPSCARAIDHRLRATRERTVSPRLQHWPSAPAGATRCLHDTTTTQRRVDLGRRSLFCRDHERDFPRFPTTPPVMCRSDRHDWRSRGSWRPPPRPSVARRPHAGPQVDDELASVRGAHWLPGWRSPPPTRGWPNRPPRSRRPGCTACARGDDAAGFATSDLRA